MERKSRNPKERPTAVEERGARAAQDTERRDDRNSSRRQKYSSDLEYAEASRSRSREYYRQSNPLKPKAHPTLLIEGQLREVICEGMDHPVSVETFSISEAAKALGRTDMTFRKWIVDGLVPAPILQDVSKPWKFYSVGELKIFAHVLTQHERDFTYYTGRHVSTKENLFQMIQGYRSMYV